MSLKVQGADRLAYFKKVYKRKALVHNMEKALNDA